MLFFLPTTITQTHKNEKNSIDFGCYSHRGLLQQLQQEMQLCLLCEQYFY